MEALAILVLASVPRRLRRRFPRVPSDFILDAVTDALIDYFARPQRRSGST